MKINTFLGSVYFAVLLSLLILLLPAEAFPQNSGESASPVYVIPIQGEINRSLTVFLRRGIEKARKSGAKVIIFDIDTYGGRVDSALQITTLIGSLDTITTAAYVALHPEGSAVSWSAGALISFSCDRIYMAPGTSMGSAAPVMQSPDGTVVPAEEKTVSAVRVQMAALAEKNGYPRSVALAMVDQDVEVLEVYIEETLHVMTREEFTDAKRRAEGEGKKIEEGFVISPKGKLLSLTAGDMEKYGLSSGTFASLDLVTQDLGFPEIQATQVDSTFYDQMVSFITSSGFTSLLVLVGIIALFMEITSPGFGIPGSIAILSFGILFASNALLGTVGSLELLLFVIGIALLIVEIFLIPGFGVTGISGILLMMTGLILSMQDFVLPQFSWEWDILGRNILIVLGNTLVGFLVFGVIIFLVPKYTPFKRLSLSLSQEASEGYTVQDSSLESRWLGKEGTAVTVLRPSGKAEIEGEVIQVETSGEYMDKGTAVEVKAINGNRILVRRKR